MLQHKTLGTRNSYLLEACRSAFQKQAPTRLCALALVHLCIKAPWHWANLLLNSSNQVAHPFTSSSVFSQFLSKLSSGLQSIPLEGDICSVSQWTLMSFGPSPFCGEHSLRVLSQPDQSQFEHLFSSSLILLLSYAQKCFLLLLSLFFLKEWIEESLISNCSVFFFLVWCFMVHWEFTVHGCAL